MGSEADLLKYYPKSKRPIDGKDGRGTNVTEAHKRLAAEFGKDYFDGSRLTGYGGYHYHERFWKRVVETFRDYYALEPSSSILDVGCAKGFMLFDFQTVMPKAAVCGVDISEYAIANAKEEIRDKVSVANALSLPFKDSSFDLVICINVLHSLSLGECKKGLREIQRVAKKHCFVMLDAWRNEAEREALMKWNLTGKTFMHVNEWQELFREIGFHGDYSWFIAESEDASEKPNSSMLGDIRE